MLEGLISRGTRGLGQQVRAEGRIRIPHPSGNLVADIYQYSGLSDQEISKALGKDIKEIFHLLEIGGESFDPNIRGFQSVNVVLAIKMNTEKVAEWWRSGDKGETMLDYWIDARRGKVIERVQKYVNGAFT